jgi:hypothetical protein
MKDRASERELGVQVPEDLRRVAFTAETPQHPPSSPASSPAWPTGAPALHTYVKNESLAPAAAYAAYGA